MAKTPRRPKSPKRPTGAPNPHPPAVTISPGPGRPTVYKPEFVDLIYRLGLLGHTDEECARFFEVDVSTLARWDAAHPEFRASRVRAREFADAQVAESLFKRARGYSHPEAHVTTYQGEVIVTPLVKHYPPDTQAATWWLKNRQPNKWRDKFDVENSGTVTAVLGVIAVPPKAIDG